MDLQYESNIVPLVVEKIRHQSGRNTPFSSALFEVKKELRVRRKLFLGSDVPLEGIVIDDKCLIEISSYLSKQTCHFWYQRDPENEKMFFRFYYMTIYALCSNKSLASCIDDIILLAECLAFSKDAFIEYMKSCLPEELIGELFDFIDLYGESLSSVRFIDAVLGAVSVLLGVITEPIVPQAHKVPGR